MGPVNLCKAAPSRRQRPRRADAGRMSERPAERVPTPRLRALPAAPVASVASGTIGFCARCGRGPSPADDPSFPSRVCARCGLGLMLCAEEPARPREGDAFLVADHLGRICALSVRAERRVGLTESEALRLGVDHLLGARGALREELLATVRFACEGEVVTVTRWPRAGPPAPEAKTRATCVRVGRCGPPPAALLVFEA